MKIPNWRRYAGAAMGLVLAAAATVGVAKPAEAGKLQLSMTVWVGYGPIFLARDMGFFKKRGLDAKLTIVSDSSLSMGAMAAGQIQGTAVTLDEILKYRSPEFCFKTVMALDDSHGADGMVTGDSVNSIADLKGKTIAMNEGSTSQFWFNYLLSKQGMTQSDFKVVNMTADDAAAAFIAGRIPAAVTWEPNLSFVKEHNKGKVLISSAATPGVILDVLVLRCDTIKNDPQDVQALVDGILEAVDYTKAHPDEAYADMAKSVGGYLSKPADFASAAGGVNFYTAAMNKSYFGTLAAPGQAQDVMKLGLQIWGKLSTIKMPITYPDVIDPSFIDK
ncbi:ABC transporter substrate-binding protein [Acidisoma cellulosilytica]|uniref:ABC transporter substrate-binding protein n=1 Tax=Acidisoma cellulosilyticum TaxID=2802395 RepID=A0A963YZU4_9PROT|nr:ABC transporter substrate-binding protein [Acidisoma cellulosilyticum]MCB8880237.1 ABC transporter substrate-binding protein [Acidisoma cellulosilyticum]